MLATEGEFLIIVIKLPSEDPCNTKASATAVIAFSWFFAD
jgi:hypothetical protein